MDWAGREISSCYLILFISIQLRNEISIYLTKIKSEIIFNVEIENLDKTAKIRNSIGTEASVHQFAPLIGFG